MEAYSIFSEVYDRFMEDVPYDAWCGNLTGFLKKEGIKRNLVTVVSQVFVNKDTQYFKSQTKLVESSTLKKKQRNWL